MGGELYIVRVKDASDIWEWDPISWEDWVETIKNTPSLRYSPINPKTDKKVVKPSSLFMVDVFDEENECWIPLLSWSEGFILFYPLENEDIFRTSMASVLFATAEKLGASIVDGRSGTVVGKELEEWSERKLFRFLLGLVSAGDGDFLDNRRLFPCKKDEHKFWIDLKDEIKIVFENYDYTCSPAFQKFVYGKGEKFKIMAAKFESRKRSQRTEELIDALANLGFSKEIEKYLCLNEYSFIGRLLEKLKKAETV